jgi:hypothetical protein
MTYDNTKSFYISKAYKFLLNYSKVFKMRL